MTILGKKELIEARRLAKKAGSWDELRRQAEQVRSRGRARAEYDARILAQYDAALKEKGFLPKTVLALNEYARMLWFIKTCLVPKANPTDLENAIKGGRLGKGNIDSVVRRLTRKRREDNIPRRRRSKNPSSINNR